jgi:uncharacterized membrane protein (UPF0127 family)
MRKQLFVFGTTMAGLVVATCSSVGGNARPNDVLANSGAVAQPANDLLANSASVAQPATALIVFGNDTILAEVADTPAERSEGLMNRSAVPDGTGMLFVFGFEASRSFWMKDTYVALDIAYIDVNFTIVSIHQMEPESEDLHSSTGPAMFALEVRQGWFQEHGIEAGDHGDVTFDPPGTS